MNGNHPASRLLDVESWEPGIHGSEDGRIHLAVSTWVADGRGTMLEWWFGHLADLETYKRWHPTDHLAFEWVEGWEPGRYVGATHLTNEWLGGGPPLLKAHVTFVPRALWLDWRQFEQVGVGGAVCASARPLFDDGTVGAPVNDLCHLALDRPGGFELRSNFWIAREAADMVEPLQRHCREEMANLAEFLPPLYAENNAALPGVT